MFDARGEIVLAISMMGESGKFDADDPAIGRLQDAAPALAEGVDEQRVVLPHPLGVGDGLVRL